MRIVKLGLVLFVLMISSAFAIPAMDWVDHDWRAVQVTFEDKSNIGNWQSTGHDGTLRQNQVSILHHKIVAASLASIDDIEIHVKLKFHSGKEVGVCVRMDDDGNGYCFSTSWGGGKGTMISKLIEDDQNPRHILAGEEFEIEQDVIYNIRVNAQGNLIRGKIWSVDDEEPDDWTAQATDNTFTKGKVGFYTYISDVEFFGMAINEDLGDIDIPEEVEEEPVEEVIDEEPEPRLFEEPKSIELPNFIIAVGNTAPSSDVILAVDISAGIAAKGYDRPSVGFAKLFSELARQVRL